MGLEPGTECRECFLRGFSEYLHRAGIRQDNLPLYLETINANLDSGATPPVAGAEAWSLLRRVSRTGNDIYRNEKRDFTVRMLAVYEPLRARFNNMPHPAMEALSAATWCNLLDVGQGRPLPSPEELMSLFHRPLAVDERAEFLRTLENSESLLILGDNAGETVIDRLFLELSGFTGRRFYMTRGEPVMNDAISDDAVQAGLDEEAEIVPGGTALPAVVPEFLTGRALEIFRTADVILAKGQGNLEGLYGLGDSRIYHSFVVKCPVIARASGADIGDGVFRRFGEGWS